MEIFQELTAANRDYVEGGAHVPRPVRPARQLAIVTCMDSRIPVFPIVGLEIGDAHVLRTAGARVTSDVLRSLTLSTHVLGTRSVAVIGHTDCGLRDPDGTLADRLSGILGHPPETLEWHTFADPEAAVAQDCERLLAWSDRPEGFSVAGYVLDVEDGRLREVVAPAAAPDLG
jgi:carbonic anhydrase